jgi:putative transcriptional regulator
MLKLNINTLAKARGIKNLAAHLTKFGFTYQPAFRLASGNIKSLPIRNIEKLCLALNCTPNDLFIFQPQANEPVPENHPLKPLIAKSDPANLIDFANEIPISKLPEFSKKLDELKSQFLKT